MTGSERLTNYLICDFLWLFNKSILLFRADSVTWNPHKLMGVPLQCSAFITKHSVMLLSIVQSCSQAWNFYLTGCLYLQGLLKECNSTHATYLFQQDKKQYDVSYDTGDKAIQCGRHNDILKLWLTWKAQVETILQSIDLPLTFQPAISFHLSSYKAIVMLSVATSFLYCRVTMDMKSM